MSQSRQLAAIMFTDIVGYTALMGRDEQKAFELLRKNREIQKPLINYFNGTWIKELGDGVMASFHTVTDAVFCAAAIHQASSSIDGLQLRIGIHLGEVVFENEDVFGDGVNIASRLQAMASIGTTWVSEAVYKNLINKKEITSEFIREEYLKNVLEPVKVYEISVKEIQGFLPDNIKAYQKNNKTATLFNKKAIYLGALIFVVLAAYFLFFNKQATRGAGSDTSTEKSIAVLPFVNMSGDKEQEYFSDGLSEELLNLLSKISELKVIGRTSSFSFKGKNEDLRSIGLKLGVGHILEGSVRKDGNKIRVTAQLIRATDGSHLWSEAYERDLEGIFKLQDEIANAVVKQLKLKLLNTTDPLVSSSTNPEVHNLILQGNYFVEKRDKENLAKALAFYLKALAIDSLDARSWAKVGHCYILQSSWDQIDRKEGMQKARIAASKSVTLDDRQPEGHYALGLVNMWDFDWAGAESEYQKVLDLEPGNADALRSMGFLHRCLGRFDEAIELTKKSITLDPIKPATYFNFGQLLYHTNRLEEAIVAYKKALELNAQFPRAHIFLGKVYLLQGKPEVALAEMVQEASDEAWRSFGLILAYEAIGRQKEVDKLLSDYIISFPKDQAYQIAEIYAVRGDKDKAFEYLEKSYIARESRLTYLKGDPLLKNLESDLRYTTFLKKMKLSVD